MVDVLLTLNSWILAKQPDAVFLNATEMQLKTARPLQLALAGMDIQHVPQILLILVTSHLVISAYAMENTIPV